MLRNETPATNIIGDQIDFADTENGGKTLNNYFSFCSSDKKFDLTIKEKTGVRVLKSYGKGHESEGFYDVDSKADECHSPFDNEPKQITTPFDIKYSHPAFMRATSCTKCNKDLTFVNGIRQVFGNYAHFDNPEGWLETKNQFVCNDCGLYFVFIVNIMYCTQTKSKYRTPHPVYKWIKNEKSPCYDTKTITWNEECMVCGNKTVSFSTDGAGCVTGKTSMYGNSVCTKCNLCHHADEHDD